MYGHRAALWCILGTPGIWWVEFRIDGVRKGSLSKHEETLPAPGDIIACAHASPLDALYLATVFDPIFTISWPDSKLVQPITLLHATLRAFAPPEVQPPPSARPHLIALSALRAANPTRVIVVFPECTPGNNRSILPLSPSLLSAPREARVFPAFLKYEAPDVTTPIPGWRSAAGFLWALCGRPKHCIRARFAGGVRNTTSEDGHLDQGESDELRGKTSTGGVTPTAKKGDEEAESPLRRTAGLGGIPREERIFLEKIGEALARLGRVKRVALGVREKVDFVRMYRNRGRGTKRR